MPGSSAAPQLPTYRPMIAAVSTWLCTGGGDGSRRRPHCDATLVLRAMGPHPRTAHADVAAVRTAEWRKRGKYPELCREGPHKLVVLVSEISGRWNEDASRFVRSLVRLHRLRVQPTLRQAAAASWARKRSTKSLLPWAGVAARRQDHVWRTCSDLLTRPPLP